MKKPEITPEEWYISDIQQEDGFYLYSKNNHYSAIARVYRQVRQNAEADAKLIAAAPNLAEVLNKIYQCVPQTLDDYNLRDEAYEALLKAGYTL